MPVVRNRRLGIAIEGEPVEIIIREIHSSNVEWIGWPKTGEPLMIVQYNGGGRYGYIGVSRQKAVAASYAPSTGGYLNRVIKPNYKAVRLR
jgi:hypothetical protein